MTSSTSLTMSSRPLSRPTSGPGRWAAMMSPTPMETNAHQVRIFRLPSGTLLQNRQRRQTGARIHHLSRLPRAKYATRAHRPVVIAQGTALPEFNLRLVVRAPGRRHECLLLRSRYRNQTSMTFLQIPAITRMISMSTCRRLGSSKTPESTWPQLIASCKPRHTKMPQQT